MRRFTTSAAVSLALFGAFLTATTWASANRNARTLLIVPDAIAFGHGKTLRSDFPHLESHTVYLVQTPGRYPRKLDLAENGTITRAELAPVGEWFAYQSPRGVMVGRVEGEGIHAFDKAVDFAWSPDAARLAVLWRGGKSENPSQRDSLVIWECIPDRAAGYRTNVDALYWSPSDTLFIQDGSHVRFLAKGIGPIRASGHRAAAVSPDGTLSIREDSLAFGGVRLQHDRGMIDVTNIALASLGSARVDFVAPPIWLRYQGTAHLACASVCGVWTDVKGRPPEWGCRVGIVDPLEGILLASRPGFLVGASGDGSVIWYTDGWDLQRLEVEDAVRRWREIHVAEPRAFRLPGKVSIRCTSDQWGGIALPPVGRTARVRVDSLSVGEEVPFDQLGKALFPSNIRVMDILATDRVVLWIGTGEWSTKVGDGPWGQHKVVILGRQPIHLQSNTVCAGTTGTIELLP